MEKIARTRYVRIRLTPAELASVEAAAKGARSVADYCRRLILPTPAAEAAIEKDTEE